MPVHVEDRCHTDDLCHNIYNKMMMNDDDELVMSFCTGNETMWKEDKIKITEKSGYIRGI